MKNVDLLRTSIVNLVGGSIKEEVLVGLIGIMLDDISLEKQIKALVKRVNLDSKLSLQLIELMSTDVEKADVYNSILNMSKDHTGHA